MEEYRGMVLMRKSGDWFAFDDNDNVIVHYAESLEDCKREVDEYYSSQFWRGLLLFVVVAAITALAVLAYS